MNHAGPFEALKMSFLFFLSFFFLSHLLTVSNCLHKKLCHLQPKLFLCGTLIQIVPSNWRSQGSMHQRGPELDSIFQCSACSRSCAEYSCWVFCDSGADFTWEVSGFRDTSRLSSVLFLRWTLILTVFGRTNGEEKLRKFSVSDFIGLNVNYFWQYRL